MKFHYKELDITTVRQGLILQVCNTEGVMGSGVAAALKASFPGIDLTYSQLCRQGANKFIVPKEKYDYLLGKVDYFKAAEGLWVGNLIAQTLEPIQRRVRYDAVVKCLENVNEFLMRQQATSGNINVYAPLMGAGLAGGRWEVMESLIHSYLNVPEITVCVMPGTKLPVQAERV